MKTFSTLLFALATLLTAGLAQAQDTTLLQRYDGGIRRGGYTVALLRSEAEVWALGLNTGNPEFDLGKLVPVKAGRHTSLLIGGYLAYQQGYGELYLLPWVTGNHQDGRLHLHAEVAYYCPLTRGGLPLLFVNDAAATWKVGRRLEVGLAGNFILPAGGSARYGIGPKVSADLGGGWFASARLLLPNRGSEAQGRATVGVRF